MLTYIKGDIFDSQADILVCPVNCVGTMGKGLALEFKNRFPHIDQVYQSVLRDGSLHIGQVYLNHLGGDRYICLFPTKWHWKEPSKMTYIQTSLRSLAFQLGYRGLYDVSIALPKVGCGLGGLDWEGQVRPYLEEYFGMTDRTIKVYV